MKEGEGSRAGPLELRSELLERGRKRRSTGWGKCRVDMEIRKRALFGG